MRHPLIARVIVAALVVGMPVSAAYAQRARPSRTRDIVTARFNAALATNGKRGTPPPGFTSPVIDARWIADFRTGLTYRPIEGPVSWQFHADSAARRADGARGFALLGSSVGTSVFWPINARTRVNGSASVGYQPAFSLLFSPAMFAGINSTGFDPITGAPSYAGSDPFTGAPGYAGADPTTGAATYNSLDPTSGTLPSELLDFSLAKSTSRTGNTFVALTRALTTRSTLSLTYGQGGRDFLYERNQDTKYWDAAGRMTYQVTRMVGVHAGFSRRAIGYYEASGLRTEPFDDIDFGIDLNNNQGLPIGLSRRTRLTFTTGSSIVATNKGRQLRLTGGANLTHTFTTSSRLALNYQRSVQAIDGFRTPVYSDSVVLGASGRIARRLNLLLSTGWVKGSEVSNPTADFEYLTGTARATVVIAPRARVYFEYLAYRNNIANAVNLPQFLTRQELRQTVRGGVSVDVSLLRGERSRPVPTR